MLNLPGGKIVNKNVDIANVDFLKALVQLQHKNFSGYVALCVKGGGFEEGTVLFDSGKIVGCAYEYYKYEKDFFGQEAFQRILNAAGATKGVMDIVELSSEQIELVLAVNQKMIFVPDQRQLEHVNIKEFSPLFEQQLGEQVKAQEGPQDRSQLLKKYKMGGLL